MWFDRRRRERILREDALKHLYHSQVRGEAVSPVALAGLLRVREKRLLSLVEAMEREGLLRVVPEGLRLTAKGRALAVRIVRAHRLWESYLAEERGVPLDRLHASAERKEHGITPEEADRLAARLGYPVRDPHGDPIPGAGGPPRRGACLLGRPVGARVRIVHLEDEPDEVITQILAEGLVVGSPLEVLEVSELGVRVRTPLGETRLAPLLAANIFVEDESEAPVRARRLSDLALGETGRIVALQCEGPLRRRLIDLGLVPGAAITARIPSALGEPIAYEVRDTLLALRRDQTRDILIEEETR